MKVILNYKLISIANFSISVQQLLYIIGVIALLYIWLRILKKVIYAKKRFDESNKFVAYTVTKYISILVSFFIILSILQVQLSVFIASSAGIFIGIGLGLQHLFYDFFSGIIILLDGSIKVGNIIEFNGKRVEVKKINFRTSLVKTREDKEIIVPNSILTKNEIVNWSNQNLQIRQSISINIKENDFDAICKLVLEVLAHNEKVLKEPKPYIRIEDFNDHGLNIKVLFWSNELVRVGRMLGDVRLGIFRKIQENNILLPSQNYVVNILKDNKEL